MDKIIAKHRDELWKIIDEEIKRNGKSCSLNHIDVSQIKDMTCLFYYSVFNGDISEWNVENVESMEQMFSDSDFSGDISIWNPVNLKKHDFMFDDSKCHKPCWYDDNINELHKKLRIKSNYSKINVELSNKNNPCLKKVKV